MIVLLSLLSGLASAVPVELPAEVDLSGWSGAAELAGVELSRAPAGPHARVQVVDGRWRVTVVDRDGRVHVLVVDEPTSEEAREDLLATVKSLAEPVSGRPVGRALVVPAPVQVKVPEPRKAPPPVQRPEAGGTATTTPPPGPVDPPPDTPEPRAEPAATGGGDRPTTPDPRPSSQALPRPVTVLDPGPALPAPRPWGPRLAVSTGLHVRARVPVAATLAVDVGLERCRTGVELGARLTPIGRTEALGPLRWWTEAALRAGVHRAGTGLRGGVAGGLTWRHFADPGGTVATTWTPRIEGHAGWGVPVGPRLTVVPRAFLVADAGRTVLSVDGTTKASLTPLSGGIEIVFERNPIRE